MPPFKIIELNNVKISIWNGIHALDGIDFMGKGLYNIRFTPTISGHYSISVKVGEHYISTDLSNGVIVHPSEASATRSFHDANSLSISGVSETFIIKLHDQFGNKVHSASGLNESDFVVLIDGVTHKCSGKLGENSISSVVEKTDTTGEYSVTYFPNLSGSYEVYLLLRSFGGLLATYFKNTDFSGAVIGNNDHLYAPFNEMPWCPVQLKGCDSMRLGTNINFHWGYGAPSGLPQDFPIDVFSVRWVGEIKSTTSEAYTFSTTQNGGVRLKICGNIIIDQFPIALSETVHGSIELEAGVFYPLILEYIHTVDDANIEFKWSSAT